MCARAAHSGYPNSPWLQLYKATDAAATLKKCANACARYGETNPTTVAAQWNSDGKYCGCLTFGHGFNGAFKDAIANKAHTVKGSCTICDLSSPASQASLKEALKCIDASTLDRSLTYTLDLADAQLPSRFSQQQVKVQACGSGASGAEKTSIALQLSAGYPLGFKSDMAASNEALAVTRGSATGGWAPITTSTDSCVSVTVDVVPGSYYLSIAHSRSKSDVNVSVQCTTSSSLAAKTAAGREKWGALQVTGLGEGYDGTYMAQDTLVNGRPLFISSKALDSGTPQQEVRRCGAVRCMKSICMCMRGELHARVALHSRVSHGVCRLVAELLRVRWQQARMGHRD